MTYSLEFGPPLLRSFLTPLFQPGQGEGAAKAPEAPGGRVTATYMTGDTAAKREALEMLKTGNGEASPQVSLLEEADV